jgi:hypothetical protein
MPRLKPKVAKSLPVGITSDTEFGFYTVNGGKPPQV